MRQVEEAGFTLVEVLISNLVGLLVIGSMAGYFVALHAACRSQMEQQSLTLSAEAAWRTLGMSIRQAGQNRENRYLVIRSSEIAIDSDLTGSGGYPDGALEHPFERQRFRMNPDLQAGAAGSDFDRYGNLQWQSGSGSFQPFISHISAAAFQTEPSGVAPLRVRAMLTGRGASFAGAKGNFPLRTFQFNFAVEKNREQWFRYDFSSP